ncbi:hypothetical protein BGZ94_005127 [Podila epigama]|nr:hypothetical protein BGZ94_005127 [Podila epigama]
MDYIVTTATLCEMICQAYEKIAVVLQEQHYSHNNHHHQHQGSTSLWNVNNLELFQKVDGRFKKIFVQLYKEFESLTRDILLNELNSIDPLGLVAGDHDWDF